MGVSVQCGRQADSVVPHNAEGVCAGQDDCFGFWNTDSMLCKMLSEVLRAPSFVELSEMLRASGKALARTARKLDGALVPPGCVDAENQPQGYNARPYAFDGPRTVCLEVADGSVVFDARRRAIQPRRQQ